MGSSLGCRVHRGLKKELQWKVAAFHLIWLNLDPVTESVPLCGDLLWLMQMSASEMKCAGQLLDLNVSHPNCTVER